MSNKFKLFASVAAPLVSLPLMVQPVAAMPQAPVMVAPIIDGGKPGVIRIQQQIVPPGAPEGEGEKQRPRRPEGGPEGGRQHGEQQQGERAPAAREQAPREQAPREQAPAQAERPREAAPAERPAAEAPAERPQRRQQQETAAPEQKPGGGEEQPRRQRQQAAEPQAEKPAAREQAAPEGGDRQPRRNAQENAAPERKPAETQAETPAPKPRENNRAATPEAAPEAPANRRNAEGQDKPQPPASREAAPAQPKLAPAAPAEAQSKPDEAKPTENKPAQAATPAEPQRPAPAEGQPQRRPTAEGQQPPAAPGEPPRNRAEQGQPPATPGAPQRQITREGQPVPGGQPPAGQPPAGQPPMGQPGAQPPATAGAQPPAAQPPVATTPEQVQRAKELAKDPSAAKSGEQVVLPVENGAAVLDSAKERPMVPPPGGPGQPPRPPAPQQAEGRPVAPPKSDADAQAGTQITRQQRDQLRALTDQRGERLDARPQFERPRGWDVREIGRADDNERNRDGARVIISIDNQTFVRHDDSRRFYDERGGRPPEYERLRDGQVREVIVRDDGTRVVTIRNRYGEIVQRTRIVRGGEEYVLYSAPELLDQRRGPDYVWRDPGYDLPPMRLTVPLNRYIADTSSEPNRDYYEFLEQPPVERVERVYSLDEVRYSARIRDKVPRIDLDTITFATGSAEIPMNQASSLRRVADAIGKVLKNDPSETFLIEGHTDAVGSDESNLVLSDQRAESVARVLTDAFGIAPENLTTQGYGERYLKVRTEAANQENRRVTIRRITPLVKPVAAKR